MAHLFSCAVGSEEHCKYHWHVWGVLTGCGPHWVSHSSWHVDFPGLHCSGSRLLCWGTVQCGLWVAYTSQIYAAEVQVLGYSPKAQTQLGLHSMPFPGLSSSGDQVLSKLTLPRCRVSYHLPGPSHLVSWVLSGSTVSGVPCVSSGELISGCDPPCRCQMTRIPGRLD